MTSTSILISGATDGIGALTAKLLGLVLFVTACASSPAPRTPTPDPPAPAGSGAAEGVEGGSATVVLASEVAWEQLNPARGDASPKAATLWGDRNGTVATGFLVRFVDGFSSPPHIHNVTYRGVVVSGLVHNDVPEAEPMWMPPGSFWTQPKGGAHITSPKGETVAYIEIDEGPYLVRPVDQAFETEEKAVNMPPANVTWGPAGAVLWEDHNGDAKGGRFTKLASGARATLRANGTMFRAVVITGRVETAIAAPMDPGSYFSSEEFVRVRCAGEGECLLYVRAGGAFEAVRED